MSDESPLFAYSKKAQKPQDGDGTAPLRARSAAATISTEAPVQDGEIVEDITVLTVSDLNRQIRAQLEGQFGLVWVRGEISNFKAHTSGHYYFALKDSGAQVKAVMFRGFNSRLKFRPHDGLEVVARGRITVYEPRGDYQITCELMEPVGAGALQKAFEQLKAKLQKEGLFDPSKKRALPAFPKHIALVTSPTGAAVRDMLNILRRRYPMALVTLVPTLVQGEAAAPKIVQALNTAYRLPMVDVIIVGRGGGSIEDMWCFNDESVARTIAASPVPIVSAVGHEIDFTIADFVADVRAPTPSAAAELVAPDKTELLRLLDKEKRALWRGWLQALNHKQRELQLLTHRLVDPQKRLQDLSLRADELTDRLLLARERFFVDCLRHVEFLRQRLRSPMDVVQLKRQKTLQMQNLLSVKMTVRLERKNSRLASLAGLLESLSPLKVVARGFSITTTHEGEVIKSTAAVSLGDRIVSRIGDGQLTSKIEKIDKI
jgi:exodeoxyribonuclease VII large subunit